MKIRNGFVSNSSSSSYVILLPKDFDVNSFSVSDEKIQKLNKWREDEDKWDQNRIREEITNFILYKYANPNDSGNYDVLAEVLEEYVIATIETGPDSGEAILIDADKALQILNRKT